jgi:hypothetical protein
MKVFATHRNRIRKKKASFPSGKKEDTSSTIARHTWVMESNIKRLHADILNFT